MEMLTKIYEVCYLKLGINENVSYKLSDLVSVKLIKLVINAVE